MQLADSEHDVIAVPRYIGVEILEKTAYSKILLCSK